MTTLAIGEHASGHLSGPDLPLISYKRLEWEAWQFPDKLSLTIRLWKGERAGSQMEHDLYEVERQDVEGLDGREWLVLNTWNPDPLNPGPYQTITGNAHDCTCTAGKCKKPLCKHRVALTMLLEQLAHPEPSPVSDPARTWETRATPAVRFDVVGKRDPVPTVDESVKDRRAFRRLLTRANLDWPTALEILNERMWPALPYRPKATLSDITKKDLETLAEEIIARVYENMGV